MGKWMASLAGANVAMEVELRVVAPTAEVPTAMVGVAMAPRTVAAPTAMVEVAKAPTVAVLRVMVEVAMARAAEEAMGAWVVAQMAILAGRVAKKAVATALEPQETVEGRAAAAGGRAHRP